MFKKSLLASLCMISALTAQAAPTPNIPITQSQLPFTISAPGTYVLTGNLTSAAALGITIEIPPGGLSGPVVLDLKGFTISSDSPTTGIQIESTSGASVSSMFKRRLDDTANPAGALKITIEKVYRVNGESTQLKGVISDVAIPSLSDSEEFGESEQEHPLAYDEVTPIANDAGGGYKPLFLDELRSRSTKRINEDPVFHDLSAENRLITQKLHNNCVSLNEEVRRNEMAEEVYLCDKGEADRISANAHDRTKYYRLMLADVDKPELLLIDRKAELETTRKGVVSTAWKKL